MLMNTGEVSCGAEGLAEVLPGVGPNWLGGECHCMGQSRSSS